MSEIDLTLKTNDGKEIPLSMDEAKELYEQLNALFGEKTTYIPSVPIVIERERFNPPYQPYPVWYSAGDSAGGFVKDGYAGARKAAQTTYSESVKFLHELQNISDSITPITPLWE